MSKKDFLKRALEFLATGRFDLMARAIQDNYKTYNFPDLNAKEDNSNVFLYLKEVINWVDHGQQYYSDGGIPARYELIKNSYQNPYPETTGYWIPTLIHVSRLNEMEHAEGIARLAAKWLVERQLENGAVRCNVEPPQEINKRNDEIYIFDCGAILQGFLKMAQEYNEDIYREAADRLSSFLLSCQCPDGTWDQYLYFNYFGSHNSLVGYALIEAGVYLGNEKYISAGDRCLNAIKKSVQKTGYIDTCEFSNKPTNLAFSHSLIYTIEGFVKAHQIFPDKDYLEVVLPTILKLMEIFEARDYYLPSHFNTKMEPVYGYSVLTANAQLADVWFKTAGILDDNKYSDSACRLMNFIRSCINICSSNLAFRGGVPSSFPIYGDYGPFTMNNWGAKYFVDASIEELGLPY